MAPPSSHLSDIPASGHLISYESSARSPGWSYPAKWLRFLLKICSGLTVLRRVLALTRRGVGGQLYGRFALPGGPTTR